MTEGIPGAQGEPFPALQLLGGMRISRAGETLRFRGQTEAALLVYLAHAGQTHQRETIADLLWEARTTRQSLSNLRTVVSRLRSQVSDVLVVTRKSLAYEPAARADVDSVQLSDRLAAIKEVRSAVDGARLRDALQLYEGDFLAGFYLADAPRFNDWLVVEQERIRQQLFSGYQRLFDHALAQGDLELGIETATHWLDRDELNENTHQQLIRLLAASGRTAAALAQYDRCAALLASELGVAPQRATTELYEQIRLGGFEAPARGAANTAAKAGQVAARRRVAHNLPREMTPFFGRSAEIEEVIQRTLDPAYPLVTLTGEGGIGKTRLSLVVARRLLEMEHPFADGLWFVSLADVRPPTERRNSSPAGVLSGAPDSVREELCTAAGSALGMLFHGQRSPSQQLLAFLKEKSCLLILDNFEPLADSSAVDLLLELLQAAPAVHLLITSRAGLDLNSEWVERLDGLPAPEEAPAGATGAAKPVVLQPDAEGYDSVRLFAERAARTSREFCLAEQLNEVVAICRAVAGLPLAIELAAAAAGRLSCAEIALGLRANMDLLATSRRDVPVRQRSMRAVFETSWQLLDEAEQRALAQLSVFRGGFRAEAARAVTGKHSPRLNGLERHSLLRQEPAGRYSMHPLLSDFAGEKLAQMRASEYGMAAGARERHAAYYLQAVGELALNSRNSPKQLAAMRVELDNIRAAWQWAIEQLNGAALNAGWQGLAAFYFRQALFQEGEEAFQWAVARWQEADSQVSGWMLTLANLRAALTAFLNSLSRHDEAIGLAQRIIDFVEAAAPTGRLEDPTLDSLRARGELAWGTALYRQGDFEQALGRLSSALAAARRAGILDEEAATRRRLGTTLLEKGDVGGARAQLERALAVYREMGDRMGEGSVLTDLGWLAQREQKLEEALRYDQQAYDVQLAIENQHGASIALINLAIVHEQQGDFSEAYAVRQQVLRFLRDIDDRYHRTLVYHGLGVQLSRVGDYDAARDFYERSLAIDRELGDAAGVAWTSNNLGLLYNHLGEFETALSFHQAAMESSKALGARTIEGLAHLRMGQDLYGLGRFAESEMAYRQALAILLELDQMVWVAETRSGLAGVLLALEEPESALAQIEPVLAYLAGQSLAGAREPLLVYWNCYLVLHASEDERAQEVLEAAHAYLRRQAGRIADARQRHSYVSNVRVHRQVIREVSRQQPPSPPAAKKS